MTNAELIDKLRTCNGYGYITCRDCPFNTNVVTCKYKIKRAAADALEELQQIADHYEQTAKDYWKEACDYKQRIAELEAQLPKESEWMTNIRWDYQQPTQTVATNAGTAFLCRSTGKPCQNATEYGYCKQTICNNCGERMKGEEK